MSRYPGTTDANIWEALRSTTAAPAYFPEYVLNGVRHRDGGLVANNPAAVSLHEARRLWPHRAIECLVSIGGLQPQSLWVIPTAAVS